MTQKPCSISDEDLREVIIFVFASDDRTANSTLRVGVMNGIVHLAGTVASLSIREAAEKLAGNIEGVRGVVNRIDAPGAPSPMRVINIDLND